MMEWLDAHAGSMQALATFVLVVLTAYYAWSTQALVRETRVTLKASARATLQARLDRLSEVFIREPSLFAGLDDATGAGNEMDARFHICNMFLGILEEAFLQYTFEKSMTREDWSAWQATADTFITRPYVVAYWQRVQRTYEPSFMRFVAERIAASNR